MQVCEYTVGFVSGRVRHCQGEHVFVAGPARKGNDRLATQNTTTEEMEAGRWTATNGLTTSQGPAPQSSSHPAAAPTAQVETKEAESTDATPHVPRAPRRSNAPTVGEGTDVNANNIVSGRRVRATQPIQSNGILRYMFK